ncbi:hypothetical protein ACXHXM_24105|nr:hypothetical protein [Rhizobium altiplani]
MQRRFLEAHHASWRPAGTDAACPRPHQMRAQRRWREGPWIRRGRDSAYNWLAAEIPLDEPFERYRVEIMDGDAVLRVSESDRAEWVYPTADELADFDHPQNSLSLRVWQLGERVSLGIPAHATCVV